MKTYYLTLSQVFPVTHAKAGLPTNFELLFKEHKKLHTIRANYDLWKKRFEKIAAGEAVLSIRQWVGKPYGKGSIQREIARLTYKDGIGIQKMLMIDKENFSIVFDTPFTTTVELKQLSENDGLSFNDWREWFKGYDLSKPLAIIHFSPFRY